MKDKSIAEVAAALGFAEPSAFTRAFKAWSGATPARWRAERVGRRPSSMTPKNLASSTTAVKASSRAPAPGSLPCFRRAHCGWRRIGRP